MEAKYKVGDRVQTQRSETFTGTVTEVYIACKVERDDGGIAYTHQDYLSHAKLSEEDAWIEGSLMVGKAMASNWIDEEDKKAIRHSAYQILGGNGVKVTEEVKQRVRSLIERAKRV